MEFPASGRIGGLADIAKQTTNTFPPDDVRISPCTYVPLVKVLDSKAGWKNNAMYPLRIVFYKQFTSLYTILQNYLEEINTGHG